MQSAECWLKTQAVCKTFQPNEDTFNANVVIGNEESQNREDFTNNAILRGLNNCSPLNCVVINKSRKVAFTLAETLITLGIISVVTTITLSVFISRYQEKLLLNQLQTANNILVNATTKLLQDEGETIKQFGNTPAERFIKYQDKLQNNLKIIKVCERLPFDNNDCNPYKISRYDPSQDKYVIDNCNVITRLKTFVLANGMKIFFNTIESESSSYYLQCNMKTNFVYDNEYIYPENRNNGTYSSSCGSMYVDINGNKGPNAINKDIFLFYIVQDGIIPAGMQQESVWCQTFEDGCGKGGRDVNNSNKCTAWALINKNMDYLRCSDLSWTGKKSCKE